MKTSSGKASILCAALLLCSAAFSSCGKNVPKSMPLNSAPEVMQTTESSYGVSMTLEIEVNLLLAKYSIDVFVDGQFADTIGNGETRAYSYVMTYGKHSVRFEKNGDSSVYGETTFDVTEEGQSFHVSGKAHEKYIETSLN